MDDQSTKKKIALEVELQDLIGIVSKSKEAPLAQPNQYLADGEELKKAWFNYVLLSVEKLHDALERMRREDLVELKKELKEEINKLEAKVTKLEEDAKLYDKEVVSPLSGKLLVLTTKLTVWGLIAGIVGSGLGSFLLWLIKEILIRSSIITPS